MCRSGLPWSSSSRTRSVVPSIVRAPYHVGIAAPESFIDKFRGQSFERRILDLAMPFRHVTADQKLDHPRMREQFLEGGVVHRWTGLGWNGLGVNGASMPSTSPGVRGAYMVGWACLPEAPCTRRLTVPVELPKRFNPVVDAPWIPASPSPHRSSRPPVARLPRSTRR